MNRSHPVPNIVLLSYGKARGGVLSHLEALGEFLRRRGYLERAIFLRSLNMPQKLLLMLKGGLSPPEARRRAILQKMRLAKEQIAGFRGGASSLYMPMIPLRPWVP